MLEQVLEGGVLPQAKQPDSAADDNGWTHKEPIGDS